MSRPGLTRHHVLRAVQRVYEAGRSPSVTTVQEALDELGIPPGSRTTVNRLLRELRERGELKGLNAALAEPASISIALQGPVAALAESLKTQAQTEIDTLQAQWEEERQKLQQQLQAQQQQCLAAEHAQHEAESALAASQDDIRHLRSALGYADQQIVSQKTQLALQAQKIEDQQQYLQDQRQQIERLTGSLERAAVEQQRQVQVLESQLFAEREAHQHCREQLADTRGMSSALSAERHRLLEEHSGMLGKILQQLTRHEP